MAAITAKTLRCYYNSYSFLCQDAEAMFFASLKENEKALLANPAIRRYLERNHHKLLRGDFFVKLTNDRALKDWYASKDATNKLSKVRWIVVLLGKLEPALHTQAHTHTHTHTNGQLVEIGHARLNLYALSMPYLCSGFRIHVVSPGRRQP